MKIEKGKQYECIKDVYMSISGNHEFVKGKVYLSEMNGCLTSESGENNHHLTGNGIADFFKPYPVYIRVNTDPINPDHYKRGNEYEPIKIIQHYSLSFELGNVIKYVLRCDSKGKREEDLKKAMRYLQYELDKIKK